MRSGTAFCDAVETGWEVASFDFRQCGLGVFLSQEKHALSPCMFPLMTEKWYTGYTKNWKFRKPLLPSFLCLKINIG